MDIQMYECLIRFNEIRVIPLWTIEQAMEKQRAVDLKRKKATPRHMRENNNINTTEEETSAKKIKTDSTAEDSNPGTPASTTTTTTTNNSDSEMDDGVAIVIPKSETPSAVSTPVLAQTETSTSTAAAAAASRELIDPVNVVITKLPVEQRGHTSYLMFATFTPQTQHPSLTQRNAEEVKSE